MSDPKLNAIVLRLFRRKMNTLDIAKALRMPEHVVAKALAEAREEDRDFDNQAPVPAVRKSSVEGGEG